MTDEYDLAPEIEEKLKSFAQSSLLLAEKAYMPPMSFLGVGGHKIFRPMIRQGMAAPYQKLVQKTKSV
jgi:hypothetical protein